MRRGTRGTGDRHLGQAIRFVRFAVAALPLLALQPLPPALPLVPAFVSFDAGDRDICGIDSRGTIRCASADVHDPAKYTVLRLPGDSRAHNVSVGAGHACALTREGRAYCWGHGGYGQLGFGRRVDSDTPVEVVAPEAFARISTGGGHTCGVAVSGNLYCWGGNWHGQLGSGSFDGSAVPVRVDSGTTYSTVSAGGIHTCGITRSSVKCWGDQRSGRLGLGRSLAHEVMTPTPVPSDLAFMDVSAGNWHTCALLEDRRVACWGGGNAGTGADSLGIPTVVGLTGVRALTAGPRNACALGVRGEVWCWGAFSGGDVNPGKAPVQFGPVRVDLPDRATAITVGGNDFGSFACAQLTRGWPRCWDSDGRYRSASSARRESLLLGLIRSAAW